GRVHPALELHVKVRWPLCRDLDRALLQVVLRSSAGLHDKLAGRQEHDVAISSVDVPLEKQVRGQPFGLWRIDVAGLVPERESSARRLTVIVLNRELNGNRRADVEEYRRLAPETQILGSLANVEAQCRFPFARLAAVDKSNGVLHLQAAQLGDHGLTGEH